MSEKIIVIDFAGTLVKKEVIEEANNLRSEILERSVPSKEEHADPEKLYKINREYVENLTGLKEDMKIHYRKNDLGFMELTGEQVKNQISSNLFQIGMYMAAKEEGPNILREGMLGQIKRMKDLNYKLAIVSGVRTDIISGMLQIAKIPIEFDYIYGQPPILGLDNQNIAIKDLQSKGSIEYVIGDKISDLERVKDTKKIFIKGGHDLGNEEDIADYIISEPYDLQEIIK